jgi:hypothetical protein
MGISILELLVSPRLCCNWKPLSTNARQFGQNNKWYLITLLLRFNAIPNPYPNCKHRVVKKTQAAPRLVCYEKRNLSRSVEISSPEHPSCPLAVLWSTYHTMTPSRSVSRSVLVPDCRNHSRSIRRARLTHSHVARDHMPIHTNKRPYDNP